MGVLGLWKLIDASGKPVPLETLEGKVLAVDVSIWIHQVIQGYQDRRGNAVPNAHLIGLFNRLCKLMYYKIKPVFVFDGGVPLLKKNTIAHRRKMKSIALTKAQKLKNDLINSLVKQTAVKGALEKNNSVKGQEVLQNFLSALPGTSSSEPDMYDLPEIPSMKEIFASDQNYKLDDDDDEKELSPRKQIKWCGNIHSVNVNTEEFKSLPADIRYDILSELKETRKQNSWGQVHQMPSGTHNYSGFQLNRLMKRRFVQESMEKAEKEMGGKTLTLNELDQLMTDQGISTTLNDDAYRIASDSFSRVVYMKLQNESQKVEELDQKTLSIEESHSDSNDTINDVSSNDMIDSPLVDNLDEYDLNEFWESDEDFERSYIAADAEASKFETNPALNYMLEYSGLSRKEILRVLEESKNKKPSKSSLKPFRKKAPKRTPKRKAIKNESNDTISKNVRDIAGDTQITLEDSSSESDDFVEVTEDQSKDSDGDKTITKESSDSDSDFLEIEDVPIPDHIFKPALEKVPSFDITVKKEDKIKDDIFADVFCDIFPVNKESDENCDKLEITFNRTKNSEEPNSQINLQKDEDKEFKKSDSPKKLCHISNSEDNSKNLDDDKTCEFKNSKVSELRSLQEGGIVEDEVDIFEAAEVKDKPRAELSDSEVADETVTKLELSETLKTQNVKESTEEELKLVDLESRKIPPSHAPNNDEILTNTQEEHRTDPILKKSLSLPVDEKELRIMKDKLENEREEITRQLGKIERQATSLTEKMQLEAQELLQLFGIPYIVAPMEAEAQCAFLEQAKLIDGTITDDSDIWLFGGNCVYKNFFDNNKKVLQFLAEDIQHHFHLSRKDMIILALLVGSDYTSGVSGVGPVTALEIMASFPTKESDILKGLKDFLQWLRMGKLNLTEKLGLRNKLKNVHMENGFPSQAVVQAYLNPMVDDSKEPFTWGKPKTVFLCDYAKSKFGWSRQKFEETFNPVLKRMAEKKSQATLSSYYQYSIKQMSVEEKLSKRVQTAVQKLGGKTDAEKPEKVKKSTTKKSNEDDNSSQKRKRVKKESNDVSSTSQEDEPLKKSKVDDVEDQPTCSTAPEIPKPKGLRKLPVHAAKPLKIIRDDFIPQRERAKVDSLKSKLKAIEVFRKSKQGPGFVKKGKKVVRLVKAEAELSESSDSC